MLKKLLFLFIGIVLYQGAEASHVAGGEINYQHDPLPGQPHRYFVSLQLVGDNRGINMPLQVNISYESSCFSPGIVNFNLKVGSGGSLPSSTYECVSNYDTSIYSLYIYEGHINLNGPCADWKFYYRTCCRNGAAANLANANNYYFHIEAMLNNMHGPNSSPVFIDAPARAFCLNPVLPLNWLQRSTETDGDSLYFRFGNPLDNTQLPIPFAQGYSLNQPLSSSTPILINQNGTISLSPSALEDVVVKLEIEEYRRDTLNSWYKVGQVTREMTVPILASCSSGPANPKISGGLMDTLSLNCGDSIFSIYTNSDFDLSSIAPDGSDFVLYHNNILIPIVEASAGGSNFRQIDLRLHRPVNFNDTLYLSTVMGNDMNTIVNACGYEFPVGDSVQVIFQGCSGVGMRENHQISSVYPNPTAGSVNIDFSETGHNYQIILRDSSGRLLLQQQNDPQESTHHLSLPLKSGLYLLEVRGSAGSDLHKLIIH